MVVNVSSVESANSKAADDLSEDLSTAAKPSLTPPSNGHILIVDDMPVNLRLLAGILKVAGYEVNTASSGIEALDKISSSAPDVVLLDIMMPEMDGFELCRRIKSNPETEFLPVVMVTALQETADRVTALEAGADDFLTKPVDEVEVVARVKSLVRIKRQRDALEKSYRDLQRSEAMRDNLVAMLVHDLRTPLTGILAPLEMLTSSEFGQLDEEQKELVSICTQNGYGLLDLINELLDINKMESGAMQLDLQTIQLHRLIQEVVNQVAALASSKFTQILIENYSSLPTIEADRDIIKRVLVNLIGNAIKFTPTGSIIKISTHVEERCLTPGQDNVLESLTPVIVISVSDNGPGIPPEDQEKIFEKFGQAEARQEGRKLSTGLGLTFCRLAVEAHGGRIWVESTPGEGSTFSFYIPINPESGGDPTSNGSDRLSASTRE